MDTRSRRCELEAGSGAPAHERRPGGPLQTVASSLPVVLIVEDHAVLRKSLHDWLENIVPGASVLCAASVEEALETLAHTVADVSELPAVLKAVLEHHTDHPLAGP